MNKTKIKICLICSPSAGIFDNWLPIIKKLKNETPEVSFSIIFPKIEVSSQFHKDGLLYVEMEKIFDEYYSFSYLGDMKKFNSIDEVKIYYFNHQKIIKILKKLESKRFIKIFLEFFKSVFRIFFISDKKYNFDAYLLDILESSKDYIKKNIIDSDVPKFSLAHGSNLYFSSKNPLSLKKPKNIVNFLISKKEEDFYSKKFDLKKEEQIEIGFPRHDNLWIEEILFKEQGKESWNDYIVVFSRPISDYLPKERKFFIV